MRQENRESYYENTDFSELMKTKGTIKGAAKRITLNISDTIYEEANELDSYMQMGYQNVLKTAMTIGLTELYNQVSRHTVRKTTTARSRSWRARSKKTAREQQSALRQTRRARHSQG